jgi:hypothetical protein
MAPDAELAAPVDEKGMRVGRMVPTGAMAVLTHDMGVGGTHEVIIFVFMTTLAVGYGTVLDLHSLPFGLAPLAVPAVHVPPFPDTEAPRDQGVMSDNSQNGNCQHDHEWSPDMALHQSSLMPRSCIEIFTCLLSLPDLSGSATGVNWKRPEENLGNWPHSFLNPSSLRDAE